MARKFSRRQKERKRKEKKGTYAPFAQPPRAEEESKRERVSYSLEQTASRGHEEERRKREMPRWELRFQIGSVQNGPYGGGVVICEWDVVRGCGNYGKKNKKDKGS